MNKFLILKFLSSQFLFSFFFYTLGNIIGSIWAKTSWGSYWNWDIKELWSLILWINCLLIIHLNSIKYNYFLNILNVFNLILILFNFLLINFIYKNSMHLYIF
ncbi:cytochrome c biogenesis protein CcsA [Candidatus Nasuia deltocephalinicola]|uniref:cytochrome c biogenesis protein CcsA n=1 Tax=Candidatus Nasuia deltocephalincola TaxID=1160784 RepID=UPI00216ACD9F|nr:cytochrome c biogenesis protein CcsA [Candidatus Nasuia deltocephalinicola]